MMINHFTTNENDEIFGKNDFDNGISYCLIIC